MVNFKKILTAPVTAAASLLGAPPAAQPDEASAMQALAGQNAQDIANLTPRQPVPPFELPGLDDSLSPAGQKKQADAEAAGQPFVPSEDDYNDAGPHGYLHKKGIHDALLAYKAELDANSPNIDYHGILQSKLRDLASMPPEHHTNPLLLMAMAMGNPEHAQELIKEHNANEQAANDKQSKRWQDLLDMKQQALEGSIKQALSEGEHRKVVSGKWLEQLAQIEDDKAKLAGQLKVGKQQQDAAEARARLRGDYALDVVKARAEAMLSAVTNKMSAADQRDALDNATKMAGMLMKNGMNTDDAIEQALTYVQSRVGSGSSAVPAGAATPVKPAVNPIEAQVQANRKH